MNETRCTMIANTPRTRNCDDCKQGICWTGRFSDPVPGSLCVEIPRLATIDRSKNWVAEATSPTDSLFACDRSERTECVCSRGVIRSVQTWVATSFRFYPFLKSVQHFTEAGRLVNLRSSEYPFHPCYINIVCTGEMVVFPTSTLAGAEPRFHSRRPGGQVNAEVHCRHGAVCACCVVSGVSGCCFRYWHRAAERTDLQPGRRRRDGAGPVVRHCVVQAASIVL